VITATTTNSQGVMAHVLVVAWSDGVMHHVEKLAPYSFPCDTVTTVTTGLFGTGRHTVEFAFYRQSTTTEIGRASITVEEGGPPPPPQAAPPTPGDLRITVVQKTCWMVRPGTSSPQDASKVRQIHEP
jgi:hypothetical protein